MCPLHSRAALAGILLALALPLSAAAQSDPREPTILPEAEQPAWNAIGRVNIAGLRRRGMCTGTLVAPDLVLTAAHCLYRGDGKVARPEDVHFVAGWRAGAYAAHRSGAAVRIGAGFALGALPSAETIAADVGFIVLQEPITDEKVQSLPLSPLPEEAVSLALLGYRMDRPHALSRQTACGVGYRTAALIGLDCPVSPGASGAPVLWLSPAGWQVVAIISASTAESSPVSALAPLVAGRTQPQ
ncbi:trypsin-like serine peptidase [Tropicimonas isoalkanivorans]|uniref:V8-like Glu-specific endopeptidase n=1 Tax=Tropicimonas isoalkanivorans TaxID=441112 RepID=A0A1I1K9Z5_9RHOB|nr:trypsin-like peptidase domain-containing protein [Tropicimonas isoalkanivorans]SFC57351.1 V8-like Glu-specific endopeptidase [Tropicimonas isoalkanivorans]